MYLYEESDSVDDGPAHGVQSQREDDGIKFGLLFYDLQRDRGCTNHRELAENERSDTSTGTDIYIGTEVTAYRLIVERLNVYQVLLLR
jgi:hypothetical protein